MRIHYSTLPLQPGTTATNVRPAPHPECDPKHVPSPLTSRWKSTPSICSSVVQCSIRPAISISFDLVWGRDFEIDTHRKTERNASLNHISKPFSPLKYTSSSTSFLVNYLLLVSCPFLACVDNLWDRMSFFKLLRTQPLSRIISITIFAFPSVHKGRLPL